MTPDRISSRTLSWLWPAALTVLACALIGFSSVVSLTERPEVIQASLLTKAYYSLGLFVVGGLDIGVPVGGPLYGRILLWIAYFCAPLLTVSALLEAVWSVMAPHRWKLRRLRNHIVINGSGDMASSYLRILREHGNTTPVIVVDEKVDEVRELELTTSYNVTVVVGDITHDFLLKELRLKRASRVLLLGADNFLAYEAASKVLRRFPRLEGRIIIHSASLRFLRAMQDTKIDKQSINFNSYNLAAKGLVRDSLAGHFKRTEGKDTVVLAGFGLFGQTILEELQNSARDHIDFVAIIDIEANRRIQVVDEQQSMEPHSNRAVFEGDVSNPDVWGKLRSQVDLSKGEPVVVLGTGNAAVNLRTALWLKQKHPNALVFSRTQDVSQFAQEVGRDHDIKTISITQLVEDNIPHEWLE